MTTELATIKSALTIDTLVADMLAVAEGIQAFDLTADEDSCRRVEYALELLTRVQKDFNAEMSARRTRKQHQYIPSCIHSFVEPGEWMRRGTCRLCGTQWEE